MNILDKAPVVDKDAFVAPSASIIGDVQVGRGSSIWYGCVLRGKAFCVQSSSLAQIWAVVILVPCQCERKCSFFYSLSDVSGSNF